jgi:glycosyltransferase involved in cell wall biosynthesis
MAVSIPVVAPCVAGVPELVQHDASGLLYCVSDWAGLAQQLERLIRDSVLRRQLGVSGQARVRQEFDVRRAVQPLAERLQAWSISSDTGR